MPETATPDHPAATVELRLTIGGMTCAACAARVERSLNGLAGVEASVNLATERAAVSYDPALLGVSDLVVAVRATGYEASADAATPAASADRSWLRPAIAIALALPVVALGMVGSLRFSGWEWVSLVLAAAVVLGCGVGFHRVAVKAARHGGATMDTLVSIGTLAALGWSVAAVVRGGPVYFDSAAAITAVILTGRALEQRGRRRAGSAVASLAELTGGRVRLLLASGGEREVAAGELAVGDLFVVRPGERIAADGVVVEGSASIDRSALTGESLPAVAEAGADVFGGAIDLDGRLVVRAVRVGDDAAIGRIARLVEEAQAGKAQIQRLADRVSAVFVPAVITLAAGTLVVRLALGDGAGHAVATAVAVLIVACPCALGLATPAALLAGVGRGAQLGVLIRGPRVLESIRDVTTVVLDKTGTLTEGRLEVTGMDVADGFDRSQVLRLAGAVEAAGEHPVARAVAALARAETGPAAPVTGVRATPGVGVTGQVDGHRVSVGRAAEGIAVEIDGVSAARLTVVDRLRPGSREAVERLRALGLSPLLLTGDAEPAARLVAAQVGIDRVAAGVMPDEKAAEVARLQAAGERVAMVGDGVNDAAALAVADLGIAVGGGADVALEAADVNLLGSDLGAASDAIELARRTRRTIEVNLFWAFAYNVAALPLAVAGLLNPAIAAVAMACSSLFVVGNSLRLRRFRPNRGRIAT